MILDNPLDNPEKPPPKQAKMSCVNAVVSNVDWWLQDLAFENSVHTQINFIVPQVVKTKPAKHQNQSGTIFTDNLWCSPICRLSIYKHICWIFRSSFFSAFTLQSNAFFSFVAWEKRLLHIWFFLFVVACSSLALHLVSSSLFTTIASPSYNM